ncbi:type II toxin-antitoxin system RelE/ParE family toxin [Lacticaseibacillus paracasei]|uniref:type II toxin-antitoxin system RelE/ParE family toxin n=1 Tax=Lacticaseibacillus paracasei TaxID=1597 RepID=UPI0021D23D76|nr:type II toxin-antitoxin system RelE/ParE family toxin [Lacticaseibacillus paracasei]MCU6430013.1 type II toxin-antitoxin system RelE/ParE family toxin [Lacticaseibacillus paracasei]
MYRITFYEDSDGYSDFETFLEELLSSNEKSRHTLLKKVRYQMKLLEELGPKLREPQVKALKGYAHPLFELRPMPERIFFAYWDQNRYVILSHYTKRQNKSDSREIQRALRRLDDWLSRKGKS